MQSKENIKNVPQTIPISFAQKVIILLGMAFSVILFNLFGIVMFHYLAYPLPFLTAPSLYQSPFTTPSYLHNGLLYSLFFLQHVIMSHMAYKKMMASIVPKYALHQRNIFNIVSSLLYIYILYSAQPISDSAQAVVIFPQWLTLPLAILGLISFISSFAAIGIDLFNPFPLSQLIHGKQMTIYPDDYPVNIGLCTSGVFGIVRHPMQFGLLFSITFAGNVFTIDRIIIVLMNLFGILIGLYFEEKRLVKKFSGYGEYMKKVRWMLIPGIL